MEKLTLFWGGRDELSFTWRITGGPQSNHLATDDLPTENQSQQILSTENEPLAQYQIESKELLKADLACIADMVSFSSVGSVTLILSSTDVATALLEVPNKAKKLLRKAVPYMLEDELATPVDELFFAFGERDKNGLLSVRAIDRHYLESLIEDFNKVDIRLTNIVLDIDLVSPPEQGIKLVVKANQCLNVDADNKRWHCHSDDYGWLVEKQINTEDVDNDLPVAVTMDLYSELPTDEFIRQLPVGRFAVQALKVDDIYDFLLDQNSAGINFLQAEYEPKKENSKLTGFLLKVASLAGFVLLTHLIYQGANIYSLSEQKNQLDQQKITLYKQAFPNSKNTRNPEKSMRVYLKSIGGSSSSSDFLTLLNSTTELLNDLDKIYPTNISFESSRGELRFDVIASDLIALDQYAEALRNSGHQVDKSSETQRGEGYSSRLTISK